jgi:Na+/proline symporter
MNNDYIILTCLVGYVLVLLGLGVIANKSKKEVSLKEFYLAGGRMTAFVLVFTLYATQYSANTILLVPAEVVNKGYGMIFILGYLTAMAILFLSYSPTLYHLAKKESFITPSDYLDHRYNHKYLSLTASIVYILVSINYILAQLLAMGYIIESITGGILPYWSGVVSFAIVVIIYETLGGMRAVAWTDVIQGLLLFVGILGIFFIILPTPEKLAEVTKWMLEVKPYKVNVPTGEFQLYWASSVLMIGLGGAIYPQAIQRIFAAKNLKNLKNSLSFMVMMPFFTVFILFLLGIMVMPEYADVATAVNKDNVLPSMLHIWGEQSTFALVMSIMVTLGLVAAIMSTADSVLLTMSSIFVKDIFSKYSWKNTPEIELTHLGKIISIIIMIVLVLVALNPNLSLWGLVELKMQLLVQVTPLFILGIHTSISARSAFFGLLVGLAIAVLAFFINVKNIGGIQIGLIGLILNVTTIFLFHNFTKKGSKQNYCFSG